MDSKDGKKKESIDDILSDLNGLLNRMPSILDGIKMPKMEPPEFPAEPAAAKPPAAAQPGPVISPEPAAQPPVQAKTPAVQADAEKTLVIESLSALPEGAKAPEAGKLELQSLGDFMFGKDAEQHQQPAAPAPAAELPVPAVKPAEPELSLSAPNVAQPPAEEPARPAAAKPEEAKPSAGFQPHNPFESTRDFGVPDIDALMELSGGNPFPAAEQPAPRPEPAPAAQPAADIDVPEPSMDELAEFEKQLEAASPASQPAESAAPAPAQEPVTVPEPQFEPPAPAEPAAEPAAGPVAESVTPAAEPEPQPGGKPVPDLAFEPMFQAAEPAPQEPAAQPQAEQTLQLEPQPAAAPVEEPMQKQPEASQPQPDQTLQLEQPGMVLGASPEAAPAAAPSIEMAPGIETGAPAQKDSTLQFQAPIELSPGIQKDSTPQFGAVGQPAEPAPAAEIPAAAPAPAEEQTLVVPPPAGGQAEEKTVIFEAPAPGITSRSKAGDLAGLVSVATPEGIPADRVRSVAFLYAPPDAALCATVLSELDSICLKSAAKPMFVKRAYVRECEHDTNANYILQTAADAGAQAIVCSGSVPQDKLFELENACASSGVMFKHYDQASFGHSAALDLVMELILR